MTNTEKVRFGPAGIPLGCIGGTADGVRYVGKLDLEAMEVEFVRGVKMGAEQAREVGKAALESNVSLSAHCPYWINCCPKEKEKIETTIRNILATARAIEAMGGGVIVFHPGFYMGRDPKTCMRMAKETLEKALEIMKQEKLARVILGPESTGKISQLGTLEEVVELAASLERTKPVVDFAHVHGRNNGCIRKKGDYARIFDVMEKELGRKAVENIHAHFTEIEYNKNGERYHLELGAKNSPPFEPLAELIAEQGYGGTLICESPLLEQDAQKMKQIYKRALAKRK
ncbi:MAG: TIM barrel protein [Candidatus Micrarchaeota archaeon]